MIIERVPPKVIVGVKLSSLGCGSEFIPKYAPPTDGPYIKHETNGLDHHKCYDLGRKKWTTMDNDIIVVPVSISMTVQPVCGYSF